MAAITSTMRMIDQVSRPMQNMTRAMNSTLQVVRGIEGVELGNTFAQAAADVRLAEQAIEDMNRGLQEVPGGARAAGDGFTIMKSVAANAISSIVNDLSNKLTSGIDKAMKRIDTMEQFSRTMTTLTGSSATASQALEDVRKTVTGTAYGLDVAASSVQSFVTAGMNIDKATTQIGALADAVAFYGDGTNASLGSVADAWAKMASSGKVSAQKIQSLTDQGIPVYQIYASAVGKSVADVQKALSKGSISARQFQETVTEALISGTDHFASVSGAALSAGTSWTGVFDNMGAAISRGWVNIITSIDDALAASGLPKMREIVTNVGSAMESFLNLIADNAENILAFASGVAAAAVAIGIYSAAQWIATGAAAAFFTTLLANPLTWLVLGIGLVVMAIAKWVQSVGGIQIAWAIVQDALSTGWENIKLGFSAGVTKVQNFLDKMGLGFSKVGASIAGYMGDMKVNVLTILQNMVNGAIDIINGFINKVNSVTGIGIETIAHVTFAADATIENEAAKAARAAGIEQQEKDVVWAALKRQEEYDTMAAKNRAAQAERQANIAAMRASKSSEVAESVSGIASSLDDLTDGSGFNSKLKTKGDVNIASEDLQLMLDLATRQYKMDYQLIAPQITVSVDTIRETADVDYVVQEITTAVHNLSGASLTAGAI